MLGQLSCILLSSRIVCKYNGFSFFTGLYHIFFLTWYYQRQDSLNSCVMDYANPCPPYWQLYSVLSYFGNLHDVLKSTAKKFSNDVSVYFAKLCFWNLYWCSYILFHYLSNARPSHLFLISASLRNITKYLIYAYFIYWTSNWILNL